MPVKIRLMRIGATKRPFYRVVAVDERKKRTGGYLELLGTYNPLTEPKEINLKQDRIDDWVKKGAQYSDGFLRIIGKAPQRPARKPKKEKGKGDEGEMKKSDEGEKIEEVKVEETAVEEKAEEAKTEEEAVTSVHPAEEKSEDVSEEKDNKEGEKPEVEEDKTEEKV